MDFCNRWSQLTKKELLDLPDGNHRLYIKLFRTPFHKPPDLYMEGKWTIIKDNLPEINQYALNKSALISFSSLNWIQYDISSDSSETGDLCYEDYLCQIFSRKLNS